MEPRRCDVHGLVVGADGRCVVCRRGDPEVAESAKSREWPLVIALSFFAALIVFSGGYWLTRRLASMSVSPPAVTVVVPTATSEEEEPAVDTPAPRAVVQAPQSTLEAEPPPERKTALSAEELEALKRRVKVTMYSTDPCALCSSARSFLKNRRYSLTELDIDQSATDKVLLEAINPAKSVPTFDVQGKVLIGYDREALDRAIEDAARAQLPK